MCSFVHIKKILMVFSFKSFNDSKLRGKLKFAWAWLLCLGCGLYCPHEILLKLAPLQTFEKSDGTCLAGRL